VNRYLAEIAYSGSGFSGLQRQPGRRTVQGDFEEALSALGTGGSFAAAGRTDAGVHARRMPVSFDLARDWPDERLLRALNAHLPPDVRVLRCAAVEGTFHARFRAREREYRYFFWSAPACPPFFRPYVHPVSPRWDERAADRAARALEGRHDFSAFCRPGDRPPDPFRTVRAIRVRRQGALIVLSVRGDGFLTNMVRLMGGLLDRIARGRAPEERTAEVLRGRVGCGAILPPEGLFFWRALYDPSPWGSSSGGRRSPGEGEALQ